MFPLATIPPAILDTVLGRLALLFLAGANGDLTAARDAANYMLATYQVETESELVLAAEIIGFGFHTLEALSQAMADDMPLTRIIRLRGSAVSLNREAHRSRNKLEQMQRDRRAGIAQPQVEVADSQPDAPPDRPAVERAIGLIETAGDPIRAAGMSKSQGKYGGMTWSQAYQKRLAVQSMTKTAKRRQAEHAAHLGEQIAATPIEAVPAA